MNKWDEMRAAYNEAKATIIAADLMVDDMVSMVSGRLRRLDLTYETQENLRKLKKELRDFNMKTGLWK